jgi:hypothetical protein
MTDKIVGKALYLELIPTIPADGTTEVTEVQQVTQLLFVPEGFDEKGEYVPMTSHTRTVSVWSPRKQWRVSKNGVSNASLLSGGVPISQTKAQEVALEMSGKYEGIIKRQLSYGFVLRKMPIVVEVSTIDLGEAKDFKTPSALLRRIQKARVALTFPEKLV